MTEGPRTRKPVRLGRRALQAAKEASADRLAAAQFAMSQQLWVQEQRLAERVERVGEIVGAIFWTADEEHMRENDPVAGGRCATSLARQWWDCVIGFRSVMS